MAQLRQDYVKFQDRNTAVLVVGPEGPEAFRSYFERHDLPFIGLPNPKLTVLRQYGQEVNLFKMGRMPAQVIIDRNGVVRYVHYAASMSDIPTNEELLSLLDEINHELEAVNPA